MTARELAFVDPRVRVRDALRTIVRGNPAWAEPSLAVFRNRLLDLTGSDARPLADLLLDAIGRGLPVRTGEPPLDTVTWDAMVAPFILRWSAERFVQPEMTRWAVECWGYAFDMIRADQLRIAPAPVPSAPNTPLRLDRSVAAQPTAAAAHRPARPAPLAPRGATVRVAATTPQAPRPTVSSGGTRWGASTTASRSVASGAAGRSAPVHLNPWISRVLFVGLVLMGVGLVTYVSVATNASASPSAVIASRSSAGVLDAGNAVRVPLPRSSPGVPSITRAVADAAHSDSARMLFVEPPRRAAGTSRPMLLAQAGGAVALDELRFVDGRRMRGRVEIVRAGTVIFRDVSTGLRHEVDKDDVSEIITEFGTSVRFSDAPVSRAAHGDVAVRIGITAPETAIPAREPDRTSPRARGVAGRYLVRYDAASATGSRECTSVWQRAPDAVDRATVVHRPGADTLVLAFEGGDAFPSNIDREGRFASTFRIVPDQARSSTALTTRLSGQFTDGGVLALTVNIVFFRRMRAGGDLACNVTVNAVGRRE